MNVSANASVHKNKQVALDNDLKNTDNIKANLLYLQIL